jgi:glycogen debranching enzyme
MIVGALRSPSFWKILVMCFCPLLTITSRPGLPVPGNDVKLLPGERLECVHDLEIVDPPATPDPLDELCKLARVERPEEVGRNGPLIAAHATDANADEAALRLFEIVYGRDSLVAALFVGDLFPLLREATVLYLARHQGKKYDAWREEEPGRIAHMIRNPNRDANLGYPYYGTVDATPHFISAAMHAIEERPTFEAEIRPALDGAVAWLLRRLASDELGLLSHQRVNPDGIANQVWKDSWDSMSHADGTVANHAAPVASLEAQALAYDALVAVGELHAADRLARSVEEHFWLGDFYAIGVDRDPVTGAPRPLSTRASNMGWLLRSRLLDGREDRQRRIVKLLFSDEFLAESGVRTLSSQEVRFRPRSYHNGTVWPHDNYLISLGLEQRGFADEATELRRRIASFCRATHRFPEFVAGGEPGDALFTKRIVDVYDTVNDRSNRIEQPPQEILCWTVTAMVAVEHGPD